MKVGMVGERGPADLGRRRSLETQHAPATVGAVLGCRFESQQGLECAAMHYAMTGVALRLKTERVEI
jgi:hypothetical protein